MTFKEYTYLVSSSLFRYTRRKDLLTLMKLLVIGEGFKYIFWMRSCAFVYSNPILKLIFFLPCRLMLRHYQYRLGIGISYKTKIGPGFYIGHYSGIFIHDDAVVGKNCNINQGVTIGKKNGGAKAGSPYIGNEVYIAPGAKIIGNIKLEDGVCVGSNTVVTINCPKNSILVGAPARIISDKSSKDYINNIDY